jgi:hypothetical protein
MKYIINFFLLTILHLHTQSQDLKLPTDILEYQIDISKAIKYSNQNEFDMGVEYFLKANNNKPIHYWHTVYLRYILKNKFNLELYLILLKTEFEQNGISDSFKDSVYLSKINVECLREINNQIPNWQMNYLKNIDRLRINKITEIEVLDQFARKCDVSYLMGCGDSCIKSRRKIMNYIDSTYSYKFINEVIIDSSLTTRSLGESYTKFLLISRHIVRQKPNDTTFTNIAKEFYKWAVMNYFIPPDYYANLMDYCINYYIDINGIRQPKNVYGEFSYYQNKLSIDDPETIDIRRGAIGLLPLWESVADKNKLPANYLKWYKETYDHN